MLPEFIQQPNVELYHAYKRTKRSLTMSLIIKDLVKSSHRYRIELLLKGPIENI